MLKLLYTKYFVLLLFILFFYYPIETIEHGISLNILPPSFYLIVLSGIYVFFIILVNLQQYSFKVLNYTAISTTIIVLILILTFFSYMLGELYYIPAKALIVFILLFTSFSMIGIYLGAKIDRIEEFLMTHQKKISLLFWVFILVFYFLLFYSNSFDLNMVMFGFGNQIEHAGIHLATSAFVSIYGLWQVSQSKKYKLLYLLVTFITLYILGSRSALAFYLISVAFLYYRIYSWKKYMLIIMTMVGLIVLYAENIMLFLEQRERMYALFTLSAEDGSLMERKAQLAENWAFIMQGNIFTGRIMSEYLVGGAGSYIHGYLSYLQNYGIIIFTLLNILVLKILFRIIKNIRTKDTFFIFMSSSFLFVFLEFIFSRSYNAYHLFAFIIIYERYFSSLNCNRNKLKDIYCEKI